MQEMRWWDDASQIAFVYNGSLTVNIYDVGGTEFDVFSVSSPLGEYATFVQHCREWLEYMKS